MQKSKKKSPELALRTAIKLAGGQVKFAEICKKINPKARQGHVSNWANRDKKLPIQYVIFIEKYFKKAVTRYQLRPDIYQKD